MDFHGMKRKELQALCKQHGVPANLTNLEMADRLSSLYKEKEKPVPQGRSCLKNLDEIDCLNDSDAVTCKAKRVRFSPENETFEFEDSDMNRENTPAKTRAARAAMRSRVRRAEEKVSAVIENAGNSESCEETKDSPKRNTRYQAQKVIEGHVVKASPPLVREKKAKKGTKIKSRVSEIVDRSAELAPMLEMEDNACGKENGRPIRRHLRSREVVVENGSELGNEDAIIPRKNPVQTRSKKMIPKDSNEVLTTDEISKDSISAGEGEIFETGRVFRQSKRKASGDGKSELLGGELEKRKMVGRITRSRAQLVGQEASAVEGEKETGDESELQVSKDSEPVLQLEEPSKFLGRNTLRQKSVVSQTDPSVRNETRKQCKDTRLEGEASETEAGSEEKEKGSLPYGPLRRSRSNASVFKSTISPDEELATHEAVGRNHQLMHLGEPITEKAASKPAASTEILKENEKVSQHDGPLRRSRRKTSVFKSTVSPDEELETHEAVGRNHQLKQLGEQITEKAASKPEASTTILKENEKVPQHDGPLRRSRRNTSTKSSAPAADGNLMADNIVGRNEHSKNLRESTSEKETSATEVHLRRSKRSVSRHDSISASTLKDSIPDATEKNEEQKRRLQLILEEETSAIGKEPIIDELPRQSEYNASKCNIVVPARVAGEVTGKKKQQRRSKISSSKGEAPLTESMLDTEETPSIDVELSKPEAAGSKSPVFIYQEGTSEDTSKKRKSSRKVSSAKKKQHELVEVCPVISDLEEVEDHTTVNFEDIPSQSAAAVEEDVVENLTTVNLDDILSKSAVSVEEDISMENVEENLVQDDVNEGNKVDEESQFQNMRRDLDYDNSVEPQGDQYSSKVSNKLVSPASGSSSVHQPDYARSSANHENLRRELETEEDLSAGEHIDSTSNILADLAAEYDKPSVEKEQKLGLEEMYGCAEQVMHELEENLTESNESGGTKRNFRTFSEESSGVALLNPSNGEQATPNISGRRDIDDANDPETGAEFTENAVVSHVETAEIVAEQVTEIQLASSGRWSTEETPLKILITPECQTSAVMDDKVVGSCLHTVSAVDSSQEEGYQLNAQLAAVSPALLGRRNSNHAEEEKSNSHETGIMDGTTCRGESSVSDASEQKELPVLDELDGQISGKKERVTSKGTSSFSKEVKETDVSYMDLLFETASDIVEKSTPSCEHTHLKDRREEDQEEDQLKILSDIMVDNTDPMEKDEESTHVTEMVSTTIFAGKTSSNNLGCVKLLHEKSQEDAEAGKRDHEGISNMSNPSLDADEDIYNDTSKGNLDVEFTGLDGCAYPFSDKFSKDDHAAVDTVSGGSHVYSGITSQEGRRTNVDEPSVEEITPAIVEGVIAETRDFEEGVKILEFSAGFRLTPGSTAGDMEKKINYAEITQCSDGWGSYSPLSHVNALKHQDSGNAHEEMSLGTQSPHIPKQEGNQLETVSVNEVLSQQTGEDSAGVKSFTREAFPVSSSPWFLEKLYGPEEEDSEMNCNAHTAAHTPFSEQSVVTLEGIDSKGIEGHACVNHTNPVAEKESGEVLPEIEIGSVHNHHYVVVEQVNHNVDASPAESNCKDNKTSDEAIAGYSSVVHASLVAGEKISEFLPGIELGDSKEVNAQENINFGASLDEITCKESEGLEKTTSGIQKSTLEGIEEFNMLEGEHGEISVPVSQTEINARVLDEGVEFIKMNASAQVALVETAHEDAEVPTEILDEATSEKTILLPMEADFDCYETKDVVMEAKNEISLPNDELKSIDLDIHDAKDKTILINSDQYISANRETTDEIEHSRSLESKFNFEGDSSDLKHMGFIASPLVSSKGFDDRVEDEEVAHMHDSDHCLSLDIMHNNSRIAAKKTHKTIGESVMQEAENREAFTHVGSGFPNSAASDVTQADENLDMKSDGGVEMIWQEDEVKCGDIDDCREEALPEADQSSLIVPDELTSTDGANGTMKENNHFEDVNFDSMKQEDVRNSPKVTAEDCDDLVEEKSTDVKKHNGEDVLLDLNSRDIGGAAELVVEDCMACEIGSDDTNGGITWAQLAQTSPCKIDDSNISSSEAERDSISASVSQLSVSWQGGEYEPNVCCTEDGRNTEIKELIEIIPNDEINDTNEATICSTPSVDLYEDKGDTFSFVNDSSKDIYMTKESSAGKTEETEMVNCFSVVSPFNDSVDRAALEHRTLVCDTASYEFLSWGTNSVLRDGRGDEDQNSTFSISETNSTFEDSKDSTEMNENTICTEQIAKELGKHDHHMVEVEVAELNGSQLGVPTEPVFEDGSSLRDQKMGATTTTMKQEVEGENDVKELSVPTEPVLEDSSTSGDLKMATTTTMKEEADDVKEVAIPPTELAFEDDDSSIRDQEMPTTMKEEVDCENTVNEINRNDAPCVFAHNESLEDIFEKNDSDHATSDELWTRLEDTTTDDYSLTHQIGVNSSLASSETAASYEFTDREINLFSHDPFNMEEDERVATGSGRHGETGAVVEEKEAFSGPSLRSINQSPAIADSAHYKADDVRAENLNIEEFKQLSSLQLDSSMTMRNVNMKSLRSPNKFFKAFDMKENNTPSIKMEQTGNLTSTAMKVGTKRKALEDLQKTRERNNSTAR